MRGIDIFQNPYYREISTMRGRTMRGLPVSRIECSIILKSTYACEFFLNIFHQLFV